jgi:hypothetical protein
MACSVIRLGTGNDDRELRGNSDFRVAPGPGRKRQDGRTRKPEVFRSGGTSRSKLREVDFQFDGQGFRGLEQNPKTSSRWAQLAREGNKVMPRM